MLTGLLARWRERNGQKPARLDRSTHLVFPQQPAVIYAIGDIHGCLDLLLSLERQIVADAARSAGEKWLVVLGDFVDRGPSTAALIDHLSAPAPDGLRRFVLKGNHEAMMLDFIARPRAGSRWLESGGRETLLSYGVPSRALAGRPGSRAIRQLVESYVPDEHLAFLASLPSLLETPKHLLVHAGLRPGVAPSAQGEPDLLWYRDDFTETYASIGKTVVHGHQIREKPLVTPSRVALDTGAYLGGRLSAARLSADGAVQLLSAEWSPIAHDLS